MCFLSDTRKTSLQRSQSTMRVPRYPSGHCWTQSLGPDPGPWAWGRRHTVAMFSSFGDLAGSRLQLLGLRLAPTRGALC